MIAILSAIRPVDPLVALLWLSIVEPVISACTSILINDSQYVSTEILYGLVTDFKTLRIFTGFAANIAVEPTLGEWLSDPPLVQHYYRN
jgi:uncharacterized membrane protein YjdF